MIRTLIFFILLTSFIPAADLIIHDITAAKAAQMLKAESPPIIIDIRTPREFQKGHLKKAQLVDYQKDFEKKLSKLDRTQTYIFHCQSGGRSTRALPVWKKLGFTKVHHLKSGYLGWTKAKLPVVLPEKN